MISIPEELQSKLVGKEQLLEESILALKEEAKTDLSTSLEKYFDKCYIGHCEILDEKKGLSANMDNEVPYPCLECPFNSYIEKKK